MTNSCPNPIDHAMAWHELPPVIGGRADEIRMKALVAPANDPGGPEAAPRRSTCTIDDEIGDRPVSSYGGVAISRGSGGYLVSLIGGDAQMPATLAFYRRLGEALDVRDALARLWLLPALTVDDEGNVAGSHRKLGRITVTDSTSRRDRAAMRKRPRFLARRKAGVWADKHPISGRELFASR